MKRTGWVTSLLLIAASGSACREVINHYYYYYDCDSGRAECPPCDTGTLPQDSPVGSESDTPVDTGDSSPEDTGDAGDTGDTGVLQTEGSVPLIFYVQDAEYDPWNELLVAVSVHPGDTLHVIDPEAGTTASIPLDLDPISVSVAPGGGYAVVGHDGWISHVDLLGGEVLDLFAVTASAFDIVAGGNGWAYVLPEDGGHEDIRCIDLLSGDEHLHTGSSVRQQTRAKIHPDGDRIYGADNGVSPDDIERYDIGDGVAVYHDNSPYHGDYEFNGDLWMLEHGAYLVAHSGNAFWTTDDDATDMTYAGSLAPLTAVRWLDSSEERGRVYALDSNDATVVHSFDATYLNYQGNADLPPLVVDEGGDDDGSYPVDPFWLFTRGDGQGVYLLGELSDGGPGGTYPWAVITMASDDLP